MPAVEVRQRRLVALRNEGTFGVRVAATILVDGFVRGVWKIEKKKDAATLVIEPFEKLTKKDQTALIEEGERLVRFVEAEAKSIDIRFEEQA